jgi:hypothetical protein
MDIALIAGAYSGLKFAKDALQVALGYKIETETRTQISLALEKLSTAQDTLFELREELFRLQSENEQLRGELKAQQDWQVEKAKYQLQQTVGGAVVYAYSGTPKHFACPSCFTTGAIQILQDRRVISGAFEMPGCKTLYPVHSRQH